MAVLSDLVSGYGENFFSAGVCYGDWHFEGCKNVGAEGFCECEKHFTLLWMWFALKVAFCTAAV